MNKSLLLTFAIILKSIVWGQDSYVLQIINTKNEPLKNIEVKAVNSSTKSVLVSRTDNTGTVNFKLIEPGIYKFSYLDIKDATSYEKKEDGIGFSEKKITYNPKPKIVDQVIKINRTGIVFTSESNQKLKGEKNSARVKITVIDNQEKASPNVTIEAVNMEDKIKYKGQANAVGTCIFYLPINKYYEFDIEGKENLQNLKIPNYPNMDMEITVYFEKTKINETQKGDTIVQGEIAQTTGTSTHVLFTLTLLDYENNPLNNENVYVKSDKSKKVYFGKTNKMGICKFMLEKGANYLINLKHEQNICLIEAPNSNSFATYTSQRRYRGSVVIEKIMQEQLAEAKRIEEEEKKEQLKNKAFYEGKFIPTYSSTPIRKAEAPQNYLTKTNEGFTLNFKSSGPIGTPTISGDKLFTKAGFYSPNFYCLQANTGQFVWGIELGESGISPAVLHKDVLLINTASCTLYAIDALSGNLLWSKWLSGYVYSTPTASENNVYVVYNHGGKFVLVSFDLRSGKFNWLRPVDNESIACPVVEGNEVHISSQSGTYYVFDKNTGIPIMKSKKFKAISSPTISENDIFLSAEISGKEQLIVLNRKTLEIKRKYETPFDAINISGARNQDTPEQMSFNGSHPINYQNKVIIVTDREHVMAFDAVSEKLLWKQSISVNSNLLPIVLNNQVILASKTGEIVTYDIYNGTLQKIYSSKSEIDGQTLSTNGLLFIPNDSNLSVIKSPQNIPLNQWNKDASHNAFWKL